MIMQNALQTTAVTSTDLQTALIDIRHAAADLYRFTDNLALLKIVHQVAVQLIKSVNDIQKMLQQNFSPELLSDALKSSKSVLYLEEIVDADMMSEFEAYVLPFAQSLDDKELTRFLSEVTDKVESKYNVLLEKTHEFNALLEEFLD
jgi:hypothetical protein